MCLLSLMFPGWVGEPRADLRERLDSGKKYDTPLEVPAVTHWLKNMSHDNVLGMLEVPRYAESQRR